MSNDLSEFYTRQKEIISSIKRGDVQFVYVDADETINDWIAVVIESKTGIVYGTQCGGVGCDQRYIEGYLILCGGLSFNSEKGLITSAMLTEPFHLDKNKCVYGLSRRSLPDQKFNELLNAVSEIPIWHSPNIEDFSRDKLEIDLTRKNEICEGWIPVKTPYGRGVLIWNNCD